MRHFTPRLGRLLLFAVLAMALFVNATTPSSATTTCTPTHLAGSTFEGADGNLVADCTGFTDWANAPNRAAGIEQFIGSSDNAFGQGTKEDNAAMAVVQGSIPPNKSDLSRFYVANEFTGGSNFLYLAWERSNVLGSANMDFEINQNPTAGFTGATTGPVTLNRTPGDLLVTFDVGSNGTPTLGLLRWLTTTITNTAGQCYASSSLPCWGGRVDLNTAGLSVGTVISTTATDTISPSAQITLPAGTFGEAAVNLTQAGVFPAGTCAAFGSAFLKSRSSASFTAEVKDFIAPKSVNISNCGKVTIIKRTGPQGFNKEFGFTSNLSGSCVSDATPISFTLNASSAITNTEDCTNVPASTYTVTEGLTSGWDLTGLRCADTTTSGSSATTSLITATASITLRPDGQVICTYTNTERFGAITITKRSSTTGGALSGATFEVKGPSGNVITDTLPAGSTVCVDGLPWSGSGTNYTVHEIGAPSGYGIDNSNPPTVTVNTNATCSAATSATSATYVGATTIISDTPLPGALAISKTASPTTYSAANQPITYTYVLTNTGSVTLNGPLTVSDDHIGSLLGTPFPCGTVASLAPGNTVTCMAPYHVSSQDVTNGSVTNYAYATAATTVNGGPVTSNVVSATVNLAALSLTKTASTTTYSAVGQTITYTLVATNQGNATLRGVSISDPMLSSLSCIPLQPATLLPGASLSCIGSYAITQDNLNNGKVTNTANATGTPPSGPAVSATASTSVTAVQNAALSLAKTPSPKTYSAVGQTITYSYAVTNTGNVTLAGPFTISDDKLGTISCPTGILAPLASVTCTATYTIAQTDLDTGSITNTATASTIYSSSTITSNQTQATVIAYTNPTISTTQVITPNDTATLSGATGNVGGTITFKLFSPSAATCSGTPAYEQTVDVSKGKTTNTTFGARAEGTWRWLVVYNGDSNNAPATSACGVENFTITNQ